MRSAAECAIVLLSVVLLLPVPDKGVQHKPAQ